MQVDENGAITSWKFSDKPGRVEDFKTEIDAALALWKFAPARAAGKPIASTLDIPLLLRPPESGGPPDTKPQLIRHALPVYPYAMKSKKINGHVVVQFVVDAKGNVTKPVVVRSSHREFEPAALAAIKKWKFKPGIKNGEPVNTRMQQTFGFDWNKQM